MHYLILSAQATEPYAKRISHELWLLVRPMCAEDNETSQLWVGCYESSDKTSVCIGPLQGSQPVHKDANEHALAELIGPAVTAEEEEFISTSIQEAKGGSLNVLEMMQSIDSLSPNLRTREQLEAEGWFSANDTI